MYKWYILQPSPLEFTSGLNLEFASNFSTPPPPDFVLAEKKVHKLRVSEDGALQFSASG